MSTIVHSQHQRGHLCVRWLCMDISTCYDQCFNALHVPLLYSNEQRRLSSGSAIFQLHIRIFIFVDCISNAVELVEL